MCGCLGIVLIVIGVFMVFPPAAVALILLGVLLLFIADQ